MQGVHGGGARGGARVGGGLLCAISREIAASQIPSGMVVSVTVINPSNRFSSNLFTSERRRKRERERETRINFINLRIYHAEEEKQNSETDTNYQALLLFIKPFGYLCLTT